MSSPASPPTPGPDLRPATTRVAVVLNAASRRGRAAVPGVRRQLAAAGLDHATVVAVPDGAGLGAALRSALDAGPDLLVVGGGDGTLGAAAALLAGSPVPLGVLPLGTANDFARTLEVPFDLAGAVRTLVEGRVVDVDLGRVTDATGADGTFLNVASMGLSVGVAAHLRPGLKKRLGPVAYPVATLAAYRHHTPFSARLDFPDGDHEPVVLEDLLQLAVGNGRHYGGGNTVSPHASLDDHLLDVYAIVRGHLREHVSIARLLKDGRFVDHDRVHHLLTRRVRVSTDPAQPVNLDGEVALSTPLELAVERNALHVVVPRSSRAARLDAPA